MAKKFLLICYLLSYAVKSTARIDSADFNLIQIEVGEDYLLKNVHQKIWVEKSKIAKIETVRGQVFLKGLSLGVSSLRLDQQMRTLRVLPAGSHRTSVEWKKILKKIIGLSLDFCQDQLCLKGQIYRKEEFQKILEHIQKTSPKFLIDIQVSSDLQNFVQSFYESLQRNAGLTPYRLNLTSPWKVVVSQNDNLEAYEKILKPFGIDVQIGKQKVDLADNIKVSIKIVEMKKSLSRSLGLKPPDTYSAQLIDGLWSQGSDVVATLNASETTGDVKILASPQLLCRSGKEAEFFAGGEIPIKVFNARQKDVIWKKHGIYVKFKPLVDSVGQMSLGIETEVSSLDGQFSVDGIPALHTHRVSSHFDLVRSKTIALSGLLKSETAKNSSGWPGLSSIPILGYLFSSKNFQENQTELVVFVTPELVENGN